MPVHIGRSIVVLVTGILVGSLLLSVASALTASNFTYSSKKTGYQVLTPADMLKGNSGLGWTMSETGLTGAGCSWGPVHLPQGSHFASATFYETEGVSAPLELVIFRVNLATGGTKQVVLMPATDGSRQSFAVAVPKTWNTIDNATYEYMLQVCHDTDGVFHGARVKYTYTSAGD
jgi:hypothetical protein